MTPTQTIPRFNDNDNAKDNIPTQSPKDALQPSSKMHEGVPVVPIKTLTQQQSNNTNTFNIKQQSKGVVQVRISRRQILKMCVDNLDTGID